MNKLMLTSTLAIAAIGHAEQKRPKIKISCPRPYTCNVAWRNDVNRHYPKIAELKFKRDGRSPAVVANALSTARPKVGVYDFFVDANEGAFTQIGALKIQLQDVVTKKAFNVTITGSDKYLTLIRGWNFRVQVNGLSTSKFRLRMLAASTGKCYEMTGYDHDDEGSVTPVYDWIQGCNKLSLEAYKIY